MSGVYNAYPGFDSSKGAVNVDNIDGDPQAYVSETLAEDETGLAAGTYDYFVDMNGFKILSTQLRSVGTLEFRIWGSNQDDGEPASTCDYGDSDITLKVFGVATLTTNNSWVDNAKKLSGYHYVKIAVTVSATTDIFTIFTKKVW